MHRMKYQRLELMNLLIEIQTQLIRQIIGDVMDEEERYNAINAVVITFTAHLISFGESTVRSRSPIDGDLRKLVLDRDAWRCVKCGSKEKLNIDHVIPVIQGGLDEEDNLQTLCRACNLEKSDTIERHLS